MNHILCDVRNGDANLSKKNKFNIGEKKEKVITRRKGLKYKIFYLMLCSKNSRYVYKCLFYACMIDEEQEEQDPGAQ